MPTIVGNVATFIAIFLPTGSRRRKRIQLAFMCLCHALQNLARWADVCLDMACATMYPLIPSGPFHSVGAFERPCRCDEETMNPKTPALIMRDSVKRVQRPLPVKPQAIFRALRRLRFAANIAFASSGGQLKPR